MVRRPSWTRYTIERNIFTRAQSLCNWFLTYNYSITFSHSHHLLSHMPLALLLDCFRECKTGRNCVILRVCLPYEYTRFIALFSFYLNSTSFAVRLCACWRLCWQLNTKYFDLATIGSVIPLNGMQIIVYYTNFFRRVPFSVNNLKIMTTLKQQCFFNWKVFPTS